MTATALLAISIAVLSQVMADEIKSWLGWARRAIRFRAVAKLPAKCRERFDEEWESAIEEIPGEVFKIVYSIGLLKAAAVIRDSALKGTGEANVISDLLKRLFDITTSSIVLVLMCPLLLGISLAIKINSRGPVFYLSKRLGKKGRIFRIIKFRTMFCDTEVRRMELRNMKARENGRFVPFANVHVTQLGRFLRRTSMDEFPQFLNVLRGEMSIVGPRAPIHLEAMGWGPDNLERLNVAPGIIGLWELSNRADSSVRTPESLVETYARSRSFWLDLKIIARTVRRAFWQR